MKKTPHRANDTGVFGEQLSFLPTPEFCPILPRAGTQPAQALAELMNGDLTQLDWLKPGHSLKWRLSAAVKELKYLGWEVQRNMVDRGGKRRIALYWLHAKAKAAYFTLTRGGDADDQQH
jgi:hypothetical protein